MDQKLVKIIGLSLNHSLGIVKACKLVFDQDNKLIVFKGGVGEGKSTLHDSIQIGIHGTKAMPDNQKYGEIDLELQLSDGDFPIFVGRRSKGKKILSTFYTKDANGKIDKKPVIDGVTATASTYFEQLETALTWRMNELTSDNPTVQKKILQSMYQSQLSKIGVIFDKKHPQYDASILGLIDAAVSNRDQKDYHRKTLGGIADDLKAQGFDPDRPDTCPDFIDIGEIEAKIKEIEKQKILATAEPEAQKATDLAEIKVNAQTKIAGCMNWNNVLKENYGNEVNEYEDYTKKLDVININLESLYKLLEALNIISFYESLAKNVKLPEKITEPTEPDYIQFSDGQVIDSPKVGLGALTLLQELNKLRHEYANRAQKGSEVDISHFETQLLKLEKIKTQAAKINKIVAAIDSFHKWREANEEVVKLKGKYVKLLSGIDTGVEGLEIVPIDDDIFLMYNGAYDTKYFSNPSKEMRKLSSYSGTQKPVICLLIQNYLLSKKPKAMRYMYIDNIPIDNKTRTLLERMTEDLNLSIFLNITGDFTVDGLQSGEILIEGGEVFF